MGACLSHQHQPPAVVTGDNLPSTKKSATECRHCRQGKRGSSTLLPSPSRGCHSFALTSEPDPNKISLNTESTASLGTGITRDSSELLGEHQDQGRDIGPQTSQDEPVPFIIPDVSLPPIQPDDKPPSDRPKHVRKKSCGLVKDYLQDNGVSTRRLMVHIETPFGLPIEEVYDGVHDGDELGEGIGGVVRRITHRCTGIQRAVKRLDLGLVTRDEDLNRLLEEVKIMCCLDHPNVVCLEEVFEGKNELFLTQELCQGGDLFDRLESQPNLCYTEAGCARLIRQIISSVSYIHSKNIIHRDLKLENFLFQDEADDSELKMIDFGLSKHFVRGEIQHEAVGTPYTVAPEVILGEGYDEKCDVWGIGVITYLLLSGETPFGGDCVGDDLNEVKKNILSGNVPFDNPCWDHVSGAAVDFIKSLLKLDPADRPTAAELNELSWLKIMKRNSSFGSDESSLSPDVVDGLISFKELSTTRKFLCEVISYTLQPDQISGLHEEFEKIDVDGKGEISLSSLKEALIENSDRHPLSEPEIEAIFNGLKVRNTDLSIRWHEFIAACLSQCHIDDRNIRLAFDRLDNEHKGFITLDDLKSAMDFYGSDSRYDLQSIWVNNIIDYRYDKQHMTYDDFYKLLKLDKDREYCSPKQLLRKQIPHQTQKRKRVKVRNTLARSYINASTDPFVSDDQKTLHLLDSQLDDTPSESCNSWTRRQTLGPVSNLDMRKILLDNREPYSISDIKASKDIHNFILEASKRLEEEKKTRCRRISVTGGLFLRKASGSNLPVCHTST